MVGPASPRFPATIGSLLSTPYDHNLSVKEMVKLFPSTTEEEARMLIDQADELEVSKPSSDTLNGNEKCAEQTNLRQSITKALNAAHDQILGKEWYPGL
ncbi:MAG: hypothetical protein KDK78_07395, partial [Chlamydiia bacterium]|nr:hypothetical protein [Chlamydiia bacterium]